MPDPSYLIEASHFDFKIFLHLILSGQVLTSSFEIFMLWGNWSHIGLCSLFAGNHDQIQFYGGNHGMLSCLCSLQVLWVVSSG